MNILELIIDSVLLLAILGLSVYGAVTLPAGAQLPMRYRLGGYANWMPKNAALLAWPALGVAVFAVMLTAGRSEHAGNGHGLPLSVGLTVVLALMLVNHVGALRAALNRGGRD
jgi:hypothetical protein